MVTDYLPAWCLAYEDRFREVNVSKARVSHRSEMAGPFNRGDTITDKHFYFIFIRSFVIELPHDKTCLRGFFDQARHKPACAATEAS